MLEMFEKDDTDMQAPSLDSVPMVQYETLRKEFEMLQERLSQAQASLEASGVSEKWERIILAVLCYIAFPVRQNSSQFAGSLVLKCIGAHLSKFQITSAKLHLNSKNTDVLCCTPFTKTACTNDNRCKKGAGCHIWNQYLMCATDCHEEADNLNSRKCSVTCQQLGGATWVTLSGLDQKQLLY